MTYKVEDHQKFIVCKKSNEGYNCFPKLYLTEKTAFYDIAKTLGIDLKENIRRLTKKRYLSDSSFILEDLNFTEKDLFKYDGLSLDFFEEFTVYEVYNSRTKEFDPIILEADSINIIYDDFLKILTGGEYQICRFAKAIFNTKYTIMKI